MNLMVQVTESAWNMIPNGRYHSESSDVSLSSFSTILGDHDSVILVILSSSSALIRRHRAGSEEGADARQDADTLGNPGRLSTWSP